MLRLKSENFRSRTLSTRASRGRTLPGASKNARNRSNSAEVNFKGCPAFDTVRVAGSSSGSAERIVGGRVVVLLSDCHPDLRSMAEIRGVKSRGRNGFGK